MELAEFWRLNKVTITKAQNTKPIQHLAMIACVSKDLGLGNNGELLWHIPEDMKFFRKTTSGGIVVMGRKTFESIGHSLPKRRNIVLSRREVKGDRVEWCSSIEEVVKILQETDEPKFIIGGASLYETFLPYIETLYLTEVNAKKPADTYFPKWDRSQFQAQKLQSDSYEDVEYQIIKYTKKG